MMTAERKPSFLFSSNAACMMAGEAPKNFMPSAPFLALSLTQAIACSCYNRIFTALSKAV
jgi:hypothetical protein